MPKAAEEERTDADAHRVIYYKYDKVSEPTGYTNEDGTPNLKEHLKLCKHVAAIGDFMGYYREKLQRFIYHFGYMRLTSRVRLERLGISPGDITLIMDYSEKLNKMQRSQVQSQHWDNTAMTIEVAVAEGFPMLDAAKRAEVVARLQSVEASKRGEVLDELKALHK
eukprot:2776530-Prymnesium_polylepis.2